MEMFIHLDSDIFNLVKNGKKNVEVKLKGKILYKRRRKRMGSFGYYF